MISSLATYKRSIEPSRTFELVPEGLRDNASQLISFIEEFYEYLNSQSNPSRVIQELFSDGDIDAKSEEFIDKISFEIARSVPKTSRVDRKRLLKNLNSYYRLRGSERSVALFFSIFFDEAVSLYFPKVDLFKLSSGHYENNEYRDKNGFLSSTKKLHDGDFWQEYSYQITTGLDLNSWGQDYTRLLHPAGLKMFASLLIEVSRSSNWNREIQYESEDPTSSNDWLSVYLPPWKQSSPSERYDGYHSPKYQPGWLEAALRKLLVLSEAKINFNGEAYYEIILALANEYNRNDLVSKEWDEYIKDFDGVSVGSYDHLTPEESVATFQNVVFPGEQRFFQLQEVFSRGVLSPEFSVTRTTPAIRHIDGGSFELVSNNVERFAWDSSSARRASSSFSSGFTVSAPYLGSSWNDWIIIIEEDTEEAINIDSLNNILTISYIESVTTHSDVIELFTDTHWIVSTSTEEALFIDEESQMSGGRDERLKGLLLEGPTTNLLYNESLIDALENFSDKAQSTGIDQSPSSAVFATIEIEGETVEQFPLHDHEGESIEDFNGDDIFSFPGSPPSSRVVNFDNNNDALDHEGMSVENFTTEEEIASEEEPPVLTSSGPTWNDVASFSTPSQSSYAFSIFIRSSSRPRWRFVMDDTLFSKEYTLHENSGLLNTSSDAFSNERIEYVSNGWWRISTNIDTSESQLISLQCFTDSNVSVELYGVQLEENVNIPSSYTPYQIRGGETLRVNTSSVTSDRRGTVAISFSKFNEQRAPSVYSIGQITTTIDSSVFSSSVNGEEITSNQPLLSALAISYSDDDYIIREFNLSSATAQDEVINEMTLSNFDGVLTALEISSQ